MSRVVCVTFDPLNRVEHRYHSFDRSLAISRHRLDASWWDSFLSQITQDIRVQAGDQTVRTPSRELIDENMNLLTVIGGFDFSTAEVYETAKTE
jgi:hypothetical protein